MRVGFYQYKPAFGKVRRNLNKVIKSLSQVEADLLVLPELAFTGYFFESHQEAFHHAEEVSQSATIESLVAMCKEKDMYLVTGFTERHLDKCFNSSILIGPGGVIHVYRKLHLFNTEKNCFDSGDIPLQVDQVRDAKVGMMICFDWVFPEVARSLALMGSDIICHPSNLVLQYCQQTMLSRSLENRVFSITANRFGRENRPQGELKFTGKSQIVSPLGERLVAATAQREQLCIMEIDPEIARDKSMTDLNDVILDRRPDYYQKICKQE